MPCELDPNFICHLTTIADSIWCCLVFSMSSNPKATKRTEPSSKNPSVSKQKRPR